jgi:hypothetical protein
VMCALWQERPTLVAKPAWDALRQATAEPDGDPTATMGFPVPAPGLRAYLPWERVVRADDDRIALNGGSWGPGRLTRDPALKTWRWEPEPGVRFIPADKEWLPGGPPAPRLRLRAEATIPLARPDLPAAHEAIQDLARQLASGDLARIAASLLAGTAQSTPIERWQPGTGSASSSRQGSLACTLSAAGAMPAHLIEVMWSVSHGPDSTTLTTAAELRIEGRNNRDDRRIPLEELLEFFTAAWHAAWELIPAAVLGDVTGLPLAGPPHVDLIASAATPADLLFRSASCANLSGSRVRALAAALLRERAGGLRRGRLMYFIDLTPFRAASRPPPLTELSATITAPLKISSQDQQQLTRRAIAYMITLVSLKPRQKLTTSDPQWNDAVSARFS